jgi:hypothetical protein
MELRYGIKVRKEIGLRAGGRQPTSNGAGAPSLLVVADEGEGR